MALGEGPGPALEAIHRALEARKGPAKVGPASMVEPWREQVLALPKGGLEVQALFQILKERHGYPKGRPRLPESRTRQVLRLKGRGLSNRETATCLGVTEKAVRKILRRIGWREARPVQAHLPLESAGPGDSGSRSSGGESPLRKPSKGADPKLSAFSSPDLALLPSMDTDPSDRRLDRLLAYLGLLDDASPAFRSSDRIPGAGVLLAIPALVASGVIDCVRDVYGSLGPAFYGLRTTIVALVQMALLRIPRPEELKKHPPEALGRILGLDRGPEVKTLRRKLARLAAAGRAARFGRALAERRVAAHGSTMGFLYVDGHVRLYHGTETLPKAHVARMRLWMPTVATNTGLASDLTHQKGKSSPSGCTACPSSFSGAIEPRALLTRNRMKPAAR